MRVGALILGILGGLSGLGLASLGGLIFAIGGSQGGVVLMFGIPLASIVGGVLAIATPGLAALLMGGSAAALFWLGAQFGHSVNFLTLAPMVMSAIGAILAIMASGGVTSASRSSGTIRVARDSTVQESASNTPSGFDRAKWNALVKYDADLAMVV